jgi:hypothetical protein
VIGEDRAPEIELIQQGVEFMIASEKGIQPNVVDNAQIVFDVDMVLVLQPGKGRTVAFEPGSAQDGRFFGGATGDALNIGVHTLVESALNACGTRVERAVEIEQNRRKRHDVALCAVFRVSVRQVRRECCFA